jgi:hypothetical protein
MPVKPKEVPPPELTLPICSCTTCPAQEELKHLKERLKQLEGENATLKCDLQDFRERYWLKGKKKKSDQAHGSDPGDSEDPIPKKRGAPVGHPGWYREKPEKIDHIALVKLEKCPTCGSKDLSLCKEIEEHIQEDIEIPRVFVTLYKKWTYWCGKCQGVVTGVGEGELPKSYIGPIAKTLAVWLKYDVKISDRDLKRLFETLFKLNIVSATLSGFRDQLTRRSGDLYATLQKRLQSSTYAYMDETGWKVNGALHQLWSASTHFLSFLSIKPSRGATAAREILGEKFKGILVSDFLAVYDRLSAPLKQRCLVHLLRELKKIMQAWEGNPVVLRYCERLKKVIQDALALMRDFKNKRISQKALAERGMEFKECLKDFWTPDPSCKSLVRIGKRLKKYDDELFTFLTHPFVDGHNNQAERMIRPNVLLRKITFGNRSDKGANNHSVLMSLIQTAKLNGLSPPEVLQKILATNPQKRTLKLLGVPKGVAWPTKSLSS